MEMTASAIDSFRITTEPFFLSRGSEIEVFEAAFAARLPVMLKGPTGRPAFTSNCCTPSLPQI